MHMSNNVTSLTRSESCNAWDNQKGSICRQTEQRTGGLDYALVIGVSAIGQADGATLRSTRVRIHTMGVAFAGFVMWLRVESLMSTIWPLQLLGA